MPRPGMETPSKSQAAQSLDAAWSVFRKELNDTGYGQALKGWMQALRGIYKEDQIPVVSDSVCLALGHLRRHKSRDAPLELGDPYKPSFCQLAAYMHLLSAFGLDVSVAKLHDPAFTKEDKAFLHGLGFMIPESPEEALLQLRFDVPTLVVMWFLPFPVIELILKINWDKRRLGNIVMIGHKIEGWLDDENWLRGVKDAHVPRSRRCNLPNPSELESINKTQTGKDDLDSPASKHGLDRISLQWIPRARLEAMGAEFWNVRPLTESAWKHLVLPHEHKHTHEQCKDAKVEDSGKVKAKL